MHKTNIDLQISTDQDALFSQENSSCQNMISLIEHGERGV